MRFLPLFLLLGWSSSPVLSQSGKVDERIPVPRSSITLHHDNDFFLLTDRHYSFGLDLTYRHLLRDGRQGFRRQYALALGLKAFTPRDIESIDPADFDRPYAGTAGLKLGYGEARAMLLWQVETRFGLAGRRSGAGGFQRWYHNNVVRYQAPTWSAELPDAWYWGVQGRILREWRVVGGDFAIEFVPEGQLALGNWDQYAEGGLLFHFGRKEQAESSLAYNRLGSLKREVFFSLTYHLRSVWRDGSLEGAARGPASPLYVDSKPWLHRFGFQFVHRYRRNHYRIALTFETARVEGNLPHKYMGFAYGYAF